MTAQEAYRTFTKEFSNLVVMSCHEYDSCYVFHATPPKYAKPEKASRIFDGLFSVNKKNGEILNFRPTDLPMSERGKGKRITIFDKR